jgi:hypothetical protein
MSCLHPKDLIERIRLVNGEEYHVCRGCGAGLSKKKIPHIMQGNLRMIGSYHHDLHEEQYTCHHFNCRRQEEDRPFALCHDCAQWGKCTANEDGQCPRKHVLLSRLVHERDEYAVREYFGQCAMVEMFYFASNTWTTQRVMDKPGYDLGNPLWQYRVPVEIADAFRKEAVCKT